MKISGRQLRRIIREEASRLVRETLDEVPAEFAAGDVIEDGELTRMDEVDEFDDIKTPEERMAEKMAANPEITAAFDAVTDRESLMKTKRAWLKKLDKDEVPNAAKLYGLLDALYTRARERVIAQHGEGMFQRAPKDQATAAKDARADRILRVRDSSGRARARKF